MGDILDDEKPPAPPVRLTSQSVSHYHNQPNQHHMQYNCNFNSNSLPVDLRPLPKEPPGMSVSSSKRSYNFIHNIHRESFRQEEKLEVKTRQN